jgi:hypothetical protein
MSFDCFGEGYLYEEVKVASLIVRGSRGIAARNLLAVNSRSNGDVLFGISIA